MFADVPAFSGFSVDDPAAARAFYADVLGVRTLDVGGGMFRLLLGGGAEVLVFGKGPAHVPATFTVLNFPVPDVEAAVDALAAAGVQPQRYPGMAEHTDERGIFRGGGPLIAWFTDPAGNVFSVLQQD